MPCAASPHGQPPQRSSREPSAGERPRNKKKQRNGFARDPQARFAHAAQNPQGDLQDTENPSREHPLCGPSGRRCGAVRHRTGPRAQGGLRRHPRRCGGGPSAMRGAWRRKGAGPPQRKEQPRNAKRPAGGNIPLRASPDEFHARGRSGDAAPRAKRKAPSASATPCPPAALRCSTLGEGGLNCRVRDGTG